MSRSLKIIIGAFSLLLIATIFLRFNSHTTRKAEGIKNQAPSSIGSNTNTIDLSTHETFHSSINSNTPDFTGAIVEQKRQLAGIGIKPGMTKEQMQEQMKKFVLTQRELNAENWRRPINFYGKTVDQNNQNVSGVNVHLIWTDTSVNGSSETDVQSDLQGRFNLADKVGRILQVWLSKDGYIVSKTNQISFDYASGFFSEFANPTLFYLRKKGEGVDLITSQYGVHRDIGVNAQRDGTPIHVDFFTRKSGPNGQMEISQIKPDYGTWKTATAWSYRVAIPDGGFIETKEEFPYEAPESGYQAILQFEFKKDRSDWKEEIDKVYYIAFGNPRKYGRIHLTTTWMTGTGLEYAINPDGSRNLESK